MPTNSRELLGVAIDLLYLFQRTPGPSLTAAGVDSGGTVNFGGGDVALGEAKRLIRDLKITVKLSVWIILSSCFDVSFSGDFNCRVKTCTKYIHKTV